MQPHFQHCADLVREHDYPRYLSALILDEETRLAAFALCAFNSEISRITAQISDPMPGEIRLQWWRDAVKASDTPTGNPVQQALVETIKTHKLYIHIVDRFLNAHIFDCYNDPMIDLTAYEAYHGETSSSLFKLLVSCSRDLQSVDDDPIANACGHAGVFVGTVELLKNLPVHHHHNRSFFPPDLTSQTMLMGEDDEAVIDPLWLSEVVEYAHDHYQKARQAIAEIPHQSKIFAPLALANIELNKIAKRGIDLRARYKEPSRLKINIGLWKYGLFGLR